MRDFLKVNRWYNQPLKNPTQNVFRRFVKVPWTGLPNYLEGVQNRFAEFGNDALQTRFTKMMNGVGE